MKSVLSIILTVTFLTAAAFAQRTETLSNADVILMTESGLSKELIARKIKDSKGAFETTARALVELKKAGVADDVIALMLDAKIEMPATQTNAQAAFSESQPTQSVESRRDAHVVLASKDALRSAKTVAITKSSLNPSRQALEKELLKRADWQKLNLNIVRYKQDADLYIEIGFVPLSIVTHRYVYRIYDNKSGTVIAAGETTSWGSLAENLARSISKKLVAAFPNGK